MTNTITNLTGLEKALCTAWDGWDRDYSSCTFYDITPVPAVVERIKEKLPEYEQGAYNVYLTLHYEISKAEIMVYIPNADDPLFSLSYNIALTFTQEVRQVQQ